MVFASWYFHITFLLCSNFSATSVIYLGGRVYFLAVGNTGLIYLSSNGGVSWASPRTVKGSLTGTMKMHHFTTLHCTTLHHTTPLCTTLICTTNTLHYKTVHYTAQHQSSFIQSTVFRLPISSPLISSFIVLSSTPFNLFCGQLIFFLIPLAFFLCIFTFEL